MKGLSRFFAGVVVSGLALAMPFTAYAETLTVEGVYGSRVILPGDIEVIATESFGGDFGPDVVLALSDELGAVYIEGQPFYRLVPAATVGSTQVVVIDNSGSDPAVSIDNPNSPDAVLRGSVRSNIRDRRVPDKEVRRCVARDADDKCTERETFKIRCDELVVRLDPRILLIDATGRQLYSRTNDVSKVVRYCEDEDVELRPDDMADELRGQLVRDVVDDLAPRQRIQDIRIMESRKDLARTDRDAFRAAVKLTDDNPNAACDAFEALEANNPTQVSLLFNIGLCYEGAGALDLAADYYSRALQVDPGRDYPTYGMTRLSERRQGEAQLEARAQAKNLQ